MKRNGFSLVEALIAVGVMAGIGMGLSSMLSNASKSEKMIASRYNARQFYDELSETLKEPQCSIPELLSSGISFTDEKWASSTKVDLPSGIVGSFFKVKKGESYDKLEIANFEIGPYFDRVNSTTEYIGIDDNNMEKASLIKAAINITYIDKTTPKRSPSPLNIPIYLSLDRTANKIISCSFANKLEMMADFCASVSGEWDLGTKSCELPCPAGTVKIEGRCEPEDKAPGQVCSPTSACGVTDSNHII